MFDKPSKYKTFILRCWQERSPPQGEQNETWRFKIEDVETGTHQGFTNLDLFIKALKDTLHNEMNT